MSYGKVYSYYPNDPVVRGHYFKLHKEYARSRKLKSRQFKTKILDQIDNLHTNDPKAYWSLLSDLREDKMSHSDDQVEPKLWLEHFHYFKL